MGHVRVKNATPRAAHTAQLLLRRAGLRRGVAHRTQVAHHLAQQLGRQGCPAAGGGKADGGGAAFEPKRRRLGGPGARALWRTLPGHEGVLQSRGGCGPWKSRKQSLSSCRPSSQLWARRRDLHTSHGPWQPCAAHCRCAVDRRQLTHNSKRPPLRRSGGQRHRGQSQQAGPGACGHLRELPSISATDRVSDFSLQKRCGAGYAHRGERGPLVAYCR
jgi:hypothetical protein